ncbi:MAG TPA: phosphatidylglycerophosphatase A [Lacunisphaera sp.]|nr:phosphatidylglycerophosphatase A [Lacunisphaera sp.]
MRLAEPQWPRWLPGKFVLGCATLGPLGTRLPAPGTWGSLAGVLYALVFFGRMGWMPTLLTTVVLSYVAVGITGEASRRLGRKDPGEVNLDEFIVMPLVYLGATSSYLASWPTWATLGAGFGLFRLFDITKPFGISRLQRWPGGWGIVADDFVAALTACGALHVAGWLWTWR